MTSVVFFFLQWLPASVWLHTFFKISSFMLNRNSYRFWATWGWVNDRIFIFGWTIPLLPYVVLTFVCVYSYMMRGISRIKPGLCLITQTGISNAWLQSLMQRALSSVMGFSLLQLRWILLSYAILPMKAMNRLSLVKMEEIMDRTHIGAMLILQQKRDVSHVQHAKYGLVIGSLMVFHAHIKVCLFIFFKIVLKLYNRDATIQLAHGSIHFAVFGSVRFWWLGTSQRLFAI